MTAAKAVSLIVLVTLLLQAPVDADCIDYGDYLHWVAMVPELGAAHDVAIAGNYAYVRKDGIGLRVIDITDPTLPQIIGSVSLPTGCVGVRVAGTYAYVANWRSGLRVVDVAVPDDPRVVGTVDTPSEAYNIALTSTHPSSRTVARACRSSASRVRRIPRRSAAWTPRARRAAWL